MQIHVVQSDDSLFKLGRHYGVDYKIIAKENEIDPGKTLVIGQTIVISEAKPTPKIGVIETNGYAYVNIPDDVLEKTLPHLTYISLFSYEALETGELKPIQAEGESRVLSQAVAARVIPVLVLTNLGKGGNFDPQLASTILSSEASVSKLLDNLVAIMHQKGYNGLDVDFEFVFPSDKTAYESFLGKAATRLHNEGFFISCAIPAKEAPEATSPFAGAYDYATIGNIVDNVTLMTYEWGYASSEPMAVAPIDAVERVSRFAASQMPSSKILMGIPNYGYDWPTPFKPGNIGKTTGIVQAVETARSRSQDIRFDEQAQTPWFQYFENTKQGREVWFEDARSAKAKLSLAARHNLGGFSYWNINRFWPQSWLVQESMYDVAKS